MAVLCSVTFDLQRLLGIPNTTLLVKASKRDGTSVSSRFVAPSLGGKSFTVRKRYGGQSDRPLPGFEPGPGTLSGIEPELGETISPTVTGDGMFWLQADQMLYRE